jgi:DDE domain
LKKTGELAKRVRVRSSKYLNNTIEQDHRRVKQRLRPMLGLKSFRTAAAAQEIDDLYGLPCFTEDDRRLYFDLSPTESELVDGWAKIASKR